jgi:hypothetical protein
VLVEGGHDTGIPMLVSWLPNRLFQDTEQCYKTKLLSSLGHGPTYT